MALSIGELVGYLSLDESKFKGALSSAEGNFHATNSGMISKAAAGGLLIGAGLAAGAVIAGKALYDIGSTFDDVSDGLRVKTGETGKDLGGLVDSVKRIGTEIPDSFDTIGDTLGTLHQRLGLTGKDLETVTKQFVEAGRLTGQALDVKTFSGAFEAFGVKGKNASAVMDQLWRVSQSTGIGLNDLASSLQKNAPQLTQFGFSIRDSANLLGTLDKAGLNGNKTVGVLSKAMVQFAKDGREPKAALMETVGQIQGFIKSGNDAGAINLAAKVFGTKGAGQFVAALKSGKVSLDDLKSATAGNHDTIMQASKDTADFGEKWTIFKNQVLVALEPIATRVFNAVGDGMAFISANAGPAFAIINNAVQGFISGSSGASGAISGLGSTFSTVFAAIESIVTSTISIIQSSWAIFGDTLVSYAVGAFAAVQNVIGGAFKIIQGIFQTVAALLHGDWAGVWEGIKTITSGALQLLHGIVQQGWNLIKTAFSLAWDAIGNLVGLAWDGLKSLVSSGITALVNLVKGLPGKAVDGLSNLGSLLGHLMKAAWDAALSATTTAAGAIVTFVAGLPGKILDGFKGIGKLLLNVGGDIVQGLIDGLNNAWHKVLDVLHDLVMKIPWPVRKALGIHSPSKVFAEIGGNIVEGLVAGIKGGDGKLADAMLALAKNVGDHAGQISKAQSRHIKSLVADYKNAVDALAKYQDKLKDLKQQAADMKAQVKGGVIGTGDVSSFTGKTDEDGNTAPVTFTDIIQGLAGANAQASAFQKVLAQLKTAGIDQTSLNEIIAKGPADGLAAAQAILAQGKAGIAQVAALQTQLAATGGAIGKLASDNMYAAGIATVQGLIAGAKSQESALAKHMESLAKTMVAAIKKELKIKSPSGVFRDMGAFTGEGFRLGLADMQPAVDRQMRLLATPPGPVAGSAPWVSGQASSPGTAQVDAINRLIAANKEQSEAQSAAFKKSLEDNVAAIQVLQRQGAVQTLP